MTALFIALAYIGDNINSNSRRGDGKRGAILEGSPSSQIALNRIIFFMRASHLSLSNCDMVGYQLVIAFLFLIPKLRKSRGSVQAKSRKGENKLQKTQRI